MLGYSALTANYVKRVRRLTRWGEVSETCCYFEIRSGICKPFKTGISIKDSIYFVVCSMKRKLSTRESSV